MRFDRGLSQSQFGELIGISHANVSRYEKDQIVPSSAVLKLLESIASTDAERLAISAALHTEVPSKTIGKAHAKPTLVSKPPKKSDEEKWLETAQEFKRLAQPQNFDFVHRMMKQEIKLANKSKARKAAKSRKVG